MPKCIAVLQGRMVCHTTKSSTSVIVRIVHLADRHTEGSSAKVISEMNARTAGNANSSCSSEAVIKPYISSCETSLNYLHCLSININQTFISVSFFVCHPFSSTAIMKSSSAGFTTEPNLSGAQSLVFPPPSQCQSLLFALLRLVILTFFLRCVALLEGTYQFFVGKLLQ